MNLKLWVLADKKNTYLHIKSIYIVGSSINLMTTNTSNTSNIMSASLSFFTFFMSHCGSWPGKNSRPSDLLRPDSPLNPLYNEYQVSFPTVTRPWRCVDDLTYLPFICLVAIPQIIWPYWLEHLSDISVSASNIIMQLKPFPFSATSIDLRGSVDVQLPRTICSQSH